MRRFRAGTRAVALALVARSRRPPCATPPALRHPRRRPHGEGAGWPANPDWQKYVQSPSSQTCAGLGHGHDGRRHQPGRARIGGGGVTTLTATPRTITPHPVTVDFPRCRRVTSGSTSPRSGCQPPATRPGATCSCRAAGLRSDAGIDLAQGKPVSASEAIRAAGWDPGNLTDGVTNTENSAAHGYTSNRIPRRT